jgi:hypothetical protein
MYSRRAAPFNRRILAGALLVLAAGIGLAAQLARADSTIAHAVTATPPLQAVPATPVSKNLQQRMRGCNASADAKKLQTGARETFIKSCMAPRRTHTTSRPGSQPKPNS